MNTPIHTERLNKVRALAEDALTGPWSPLLAALGPDFVLSLIDEVIASRTGVVDAEAMEAARRIEADLKDVLPHQWQGGEQDSLTVARAALALAGVKPKEPT